MKKPFKVFSTFTGIGGFEVGIRNAAGKLPIEVVGYSEIDKYAISVYERHFKGVQNYGDITKIEASALPDFDCLVGGFPCQTFSIAGKRAGFEDTRGTLFFDLARILRAKRPRLFVFENVKGLVNHDDGRTFKTIVAAIDELGYDCQWQVLNSKNHGVPQNRERIIIVGHLRGTPRPKVFPITRSVGTPNKQGAEVRAIAQTITATYNKGGKGSHVAVVKVPEATKQGYAIAEPGDSINLAQLNSKTRRGRVGNGVANTIDTGMQQYTFDGYAIRRFTPLECERLQAFKDNWTQYGYEWYTDEHGLLQQRLKPVSDTQRYKMCGNAVTTNVIQAVFERIFA